MIQHRNFFLFLDYDGTLTPIKKHPKLGRLSRERKSILRKLAGHPGIRMAIISGRELSDLKKMVGIPGLIYAGNHGLEIEANGKYWGLPAAKRLTPLLKKIRTELAQKLRYRGILIEDKGLTLSVHYRLLPAKIFSLFSKDFIRALKPWKHQIRITHGKKVFEIRPPVDWDKGKAVKWAINKLKLKDYRPVYVGDDRTDEDAFRALGEKGTTIHVGGGKTIAKTRVKNIDGVYLYLRSLIENEG
jgi:trehalose-phosphatase